MNDAWGGFANGQIPQAALVRVKDSWFKPDVAYALANAIAECERAGIQIHINEGYRPLGVPNDQYIRDESKTSTYSSNMWFQWGRKTRGETPAAAWPPSGSVHGWGKAADIQQGGNPTVNRIFAKHGFIFNISSESWHCYYAGGSAPVSNWMEPRTDVQLKIQQALKARGQYSGACDGVWGVNSIKGIQLTVKDVGYAGAIDGIPGLQTIRCVQEYARKFGRAGSPVDGILNEAWWDAFLVGITGGPAHSAPAISAAPAPSKPVEPATPVTSITPASQPVITPTIIKEEPVSADTVEQQAEIASLPTIELGAIIPSAKGRKFAYAGYMLASLAITNTAIGFAALHAEFPAWLIVSIAVVGNLATPFGALAIANATPKAKS